MAEIKTITVNGTTYDINDARLEFPVASPTTKYLRGDNTWQTVQASSGDTKVNQTAITTSGGYPILFSTQSADRSSWTDGAKEAYVDPAIAINPSQSRLVVRASTYSGNEGQGSGFDLYDVTNNKFMGVWQVVTQGTTSTTGLSELVIGNNTASGTAGNAYGKLYLYGTNTGWVGISTTVGTTSRSYAIPDAGANADFVMTAGAQTIAGNKTFSGTVQTDVLSVQDRLVGRYTTTVNTTTSVQQYNIFSAVPTSNGVDNQIAFVVVS